jgi:hypothetical protein
VFPLCHSVSPLCLFPSLYNLPFSFFSFFWLSFLSSVSSIWLPTLFLNQILSLLFAYPIYFSHLSLLFQSWFLLLLFLTLKSLPLGLSLFCSVSVSSLCLSLCLSFVYLVSITSLFMSLFPCLHLSLCPSFLILSFSFSLSLPHQFLLYLPSNTFFLFFS